MNPSDPSTPAQNAFDRALSDTALLLDEAAAELSSRPEVKQALEDPTCDDAW